MARVETGGVLYEEASHVKKWKKLSGSKEGGRRAHGASDVKFGFFACGCTPRSEEGGAHQKVWVNKLRRGQAGESAIGGPLMGLPFLFLS